MQNEEKESAAKSDAPSGRLKRAAPLVLAGAALVIFFALDLQQYLSLEALREHRVSLQEAVQSSPFQSLLIFIGVYALLVAISFPGSSIMTIVGGFLFGLWPGLPAVVIAATLGATLIFLAARTALGDLFAKRASGFATRMERGFRENELSYMLLLRLIPVFPFWAINIAAALVNVSLRNFVIGTGVGIIPGAFVYASIGNAAGAAFDAGDDVTLTGVLTQPATILPILGLAILALLPIILKRFSKTAAQLED
ncbi:MAG: TVP38/TMEM64 family protein [Pseudomonadota bacterium]